ncbi:hypothetical protein GCM10016234_39770 [Tianweitania populi]|uniref:Uncharacterized protein n=1 Tax=Tianweitania populi TaxID=1607949 RepID=A0A8J3DTL9_9HYPH|nr:hypothetical protein GCM10016234_39770 [Tianweitania populi]
MLSRVVTNKIDDRGDKANSVHGLRVAAVEIMLGQLADHPIPAEQKRQRLDNCSLPAVI